MYLDLGSGFPDFASLEGFGRDPDALDLPGIEQDADALEVGPEGALGVFDQAGTDTAAFLGLALAGDASSLAGAFSCDSTNFRHKAAGGNWDNPGRQYFFVRIPQRAWKVFPRCAGWRSSLMRPLSSVDPGLSRVSRRVCCE